MARAATASVNWALGSGCYRSCARAAECQLVSGPRNVSQQKVLVDPRQPDHHLQTLVEPDQAAQCDQSAHPNRLGSKPDQGKYQTRSPETWYVLDRFEERSRWQFQCRPVSVGPMSHHGGKSGFYAFEHFFGNQNRYAIISSSFEFILMRVSFMKWRLITPEACLRPSYNIFVTDVLFISAKRSNGCFSRLSSLVTRTKIKKSFRLV